MRFLRDHAQTIIVVNVLLSLLLCGVMLYIHRSRLQADEAATPPVVVIERHDAAVATPPPSEGTDGQPARAD